MEKGLFYRCEKCGNIVAMVHVGGGELVCCGQPMTKLVANSVDASKEKHVPVVSKNNGLLDVAVGAVLHPMTSEHYIEWIALVSGEKMEIIHLKPGSEPKVEFLYSPSIDEVEIVNFSKDEDVVPNCEGSPCNFSYNELVSDAVTIFAYCNLHGLWKTTL